VVYVSSGDGRLYALNAQVLAVKVPSS